MKSPKSRLEQRKGTDGVRLASKKIGQPVKKEGIENPAVAKAVTKRLLDECNNPMGRIAFQIGIEEAKEFLAGGFEKVDKGTEMANVILMLVDSGEMPLEEAEEKLVKLQTAANGGVPVNEEEKEKAVRKAIDVARSIVDSISVPASGSAARKREVKKKRFK